MRFFQKTKPILFIIFTSLMTISCTPNEEIWTGENRNPVQVACGSACETIIFPYQGVTLDRIQKNKIKRFIYKKGRHTPIFVSLCATNSRQIILSEERIEAVKNEIRHFGREPIRLKSTLPADLEISRCVNLVRGKLRLYVQNCPNKTWPPSVHNIGTSFGCTTNYNLAQMGINPWDFLARSGDNGTEGARVAIGMKNFREGKEEKMTVESSDSGASDISGGGT